MFISLSRFCPSLTGLAVLCVTESVDWAMAETTVSLQVDLVLSDAAATNEPNLLNQSVLSFCVQWCSDVAKRRIAPEKRRILQ